MSKELTEERVHLTMSAMALGRIDDWRRQQRDLPPRAEAIRRLIHHGLVSAVPPAPKESADANEAGLPVYHWR